jgi:PLD-like domain
MTILFEDAFREELKSAVKEAERSVTLLSAYIKIAALAWIDDCIGSKSLNMSFVARWRPNDLLSGASDLEAYQHARTRGWRFGIDPSLHYKIYLVDDRVALLGSANLTSSGLHLEDAGNLEAGVVIEPNLLDLNRLKQHISECTWVTDDLYKEIKAYIESREAKVATSNTWPRSIQEKMLRSSTHLWVTDLLFSGPLELLTDGRAGTAEALHDLLLLGIEQTDVDKEQLLKQFYLTKVWRWVLSAIKDSSYDYVRFGELTARLHDSLLDDPKPYRREVKELISNIFEWVRYLDPEEVGIRKFEHTEALYLKARQEGD